MSDRGPDHPNSPDRTDRTDRTGGPRIRQPERKATMAGKPLIIDDLRKSYGDLRVLDGMSFTVRPGEIYGFVGANGSGKSTLALTMGGLLEPMGGAVAASDQIARGAGANPMKWKSKQLAQRIGSVFQAPEHQFVTATVREELELGPKLLKDPDGAERVDELLERLRLTHLAGANPFTLSGGEKRRLSVATVLSTAPSMVILDEPTFGQDRRTFAELLRMLRHLVDEGVTVVSITHDPLVVAAMGDHVIDLGEVGER